MANLTPTEINNLIATLKKYPYLVTAVQGGTITGAAVTGGTSTALNPLASPPSADGDTETTDVTLYETEAEVQASYLTKNNLTLTITTRNVANALSMASKIKKGDNVLDSTKEYAVCLVPITSATGEQNILFPHAFLQPGPTVTPGENGEPMTVTLTFMCKPDTTSGVPFVYAAPAT